MTALFLILFLPAVYAQSHTGVYYKLDEALPQDMSSIVANNKLKDEFDMAGSHFILLRDDIPAMDMNRLEASIREIDGISSVLSYHTMLGSGIPDFFIPEEVRNMLKQGGLQLLMVNSEYATASDQVSAQLKDLNSLVKSYDPGALITGEAALTDDLITTSAVDFQVTNYISIGAILLIVAWKRIPLPRHAGSAGGGHRAGHLYQPGRPLFHWHRHSLRLPHHHRLCPAGRHGRLRHLAGHPLPGGASKRQKRRGGH